MDTCHHDYRTLACAICGSVVHFPVYCGDRFCPTCTQTRRLRTRARINWITSRIHVSYQYSFKHIVLTIPNQSCACEGSSTLLASFRKLRQRQTWKRHVRGGLFAVEITGEPGRWHVHLHVMVEAMFFPVWTLARAWKKCSPGRIVWITRVSKARIANYLTKYVTKSSVAGLYTRHVSDALHGKRLFQPFGTWHAISQTYKEPHRPCQHCGGTDWILCTDHATPHREHVCVNDLRPP